MIAEDKAHQLRDELHTLFNINFPQDKKWNQWYFDTVYSPENALYINVGDKIASALFIEPYAMRFQNSQVKLGYISGVSTLPEFRGKGYMRRLMSDAVAEAYSQGMALTAVIPATQRLYFFYDKFGFSTTVYVDEERYTAAHTFQNHGYEATVADASMMRTLENQRECTVLHNDRQFAALTTDAGYDGGNIFAVRNGDSQAIAVAVPSRYGDIVEVKELLADCPEAAEAILGAVHRAMPGLPLSVSAFPGKRNNGLRARGMMRITDVQQVLQLIAKNVPENDMLIRVHDRLVPQNNGVFHLKNGTCQRTDSTIRRLWLDVDISTLTSIVFSTPGIGSIFNMKTQRAMLPLMLD